MGFDGTAAVVTGGGSGIGLATATLLAGAGARVGALDVRPPSGMPGVLGLTADVRDQQAVDTAVAEVARRYGGVDIVVANAGIGAVGALDEGDLDEWRRVLDVNLLGVVRTVRAALPYLRRSQTPAIVTTCSVAATVGLPRRALYSASKGALYALTLATAADLLDDGVRVCGVCPGTIDTPWVGRLLSGSEDPAAERDRLAARQPVGRLGAAEEVAAAIAYLADPSSAFCTGTMLTVDGGLTGLRVPGRSP
ncbi:MAG: SDR family oxidoreductase [Streptosporangiales bacterium]|nr:SDR family oxidoreductase [Streptosporangiales bacterium]